MQVKSTLKVLDAAKIEKKEGMAKKGHTIQTFVGTFITGCLSAKHHPGFFIINNKNTNGFSSRIIGSVMFLVNNHCICINSCSPGLFERKSGCSGNGIKNPNH